MIRNLISSLLTIVVMVACTQQPQQVRKLGATHEADSAMMEQLAFNMRMADAADRECSQWIQQDSGQYAMDDFGFWYSKTQRTSNDSLLQGGNALIRIQIHELNGTLIADTEEYFATGSDNLPIAINRSLKQMRRGEEMRIIAPWYTAYGAEGTTLIKPYTNLLIILTSIKE